MKGTEKPISPHPPSHVDATARSVDPGFRTPNTPISQKKRTKNTEKQKQFSENLPRNIASKDGLEGKYKLSEGCHCLLYCGR
jgi:hypothetical protein